MKNLDKIKNFVTRFKDLSTLGVANVSATAISTVFWFYIAALVGVNNYGEISYLIAISHVIGIISSLGAGTTLTVYTAKGEKIQPPIFVITIVSSLVASVILFFIFINIGMSLYIIGYVISILITSELLGMKLYRKYSYYMIIQRILMVVLAIGFYYLIGNVGVILGIGLSFLIYSGRLYHGFKRTKIDFSVLKPKRGFMINSYVLDLSKAFSTNSDKLIIAPLFGFMILGNYQIGFQFFSALLIIPSVVYQYILPQDASGTSHRKLKKILIIFSVGLAVFGIVMAPIIIPVILPKFTEAIQVIQIMSLAIIPASVNVVFISKFLGAEKSKIVLIGSGVFIAIQVIGILVLGNLFGINGMAFAFVLATISEALFLITMNRLLKTR